MAPAAITWDTTGFGSVYGASHYRMYTVLDPNNVIDEIYETEDPNRVYPWIDQNGSSKVLPKGVDPGQNNEGYGYATVAAASNSMASAQPADVSLRVESLAVLDTRSGRPNRRAAQVDVDRTTRVRLTLPSDREQREFNDVKVYDGDPNNGGASVWFDWLPETAGQHTLYVRVINGHDDPRPGNGVEHRGGTAAPCVCAAAGKPLTHRSRALIATSGHVGAKPGAPSLASRQRVPSEGHLAEHGDAGIAQRSPPRSLRRRSRFRSGVRRAQHSSYRLVAACPCGISRARTHPRAPGRVPEPRGGCRSWDQHPG